MASVFLSYSRKDQDFTRMLYDALAAAGRDAWVDWEGIPPSAKWLKEVYAGIDSADTFVFILSPDSLASEVCRLEAAHAIEGKKRIIPVVCREVSAPEVKAVEALAPLADINWIFFREHDDFKTSVEQLRFALDTDLDYWHLSSNLLVRAKRWEAGTKNANLTLRGLELAEAERWVTAGADKEPRPTALQLDYVSASRRARNQGQRRLLTGVSVALLVTIILSIVSTTLFQVTRVQNTQLQSRNAQLRAQVLAGQANNAILQNHQDQGLLLAVEATRRLEGSTEREALLTALESNPYLESVLQSDLTTQEAFPDVYGLAMSADGGTLIAATLEGHLSVWATQNWRLIAQFSTDPSLAGATLSPDGHIVATLGSTGLNLWDVATGARRAHLEDASATQVYLVFNSQNLAFSPDGTVLAAPECNDATCASVSFRLWDMQTNRVRTELLPAEPYHNRLGLTFSPDGTRLATSTGESVTLWDVQHGTPVAAFHPLASVRFQIVLALAFSPDGATLAMIASNRVWEMEAG